MANVTWFLPLNHYQHEITEKHGHHNLDSLDRVDISTERLRELVVNVDGWAVLNLWGETVEALREHMAREYVKPFQGQHFAELMKILEIAERKE